MPAKRYISDRSQVSDCFCFAFFLDLVRVSRQICHMTSSVTAPLPCRLYLITPPAFDIDAFRPRLNDALDGGDVACVQLRLKAPDGGPADPNDVRKAA